MIRYREVEIVQEGDVRVRIRMQADFKPSPFLRGPYAVDGKVKLATLLDMRGLSAIDARREALYFLLAYVSAEQAEKVARRFVIKLTNGLNQTRH